MSFSSPNSFALGSLGADAGIPSLNVADIPANVRNGDQRARQAYVEGLAFEQVLVNQLTKQMASSMTDSGSSSTDPGSSADGSGGAGAGLAGASAFSSLIPQALTQGIMSGGGLGLAEEFATAVDPSIGLPKPAGAPAAGAPAPSSAKSGQVGL